jgi:hypothetical protein
MQPDLELDVESLTQPDVRAQLPLRRLLRLYLDPFALFKNTSVGPLAERIEAFQYNRRHRGVLIAYAQRWALIGLACVGAMIPLCPLARAEPVLCVPIVGLELGFTLSVVLLLLSGAVYVVLGLRD